MLIFLSISFLLVNFISPIEGKISDEIANNNDFQEKCKDQAQNYQAYMTNTVKYATEFCREKDPSQSIQDVP